MCADNMIGGQCITGEQSNREQNMHASGLGRLRQCLGIGVLGACVVGLPAVVEGPSLPAHAGGQYTIVASDVDPETFHPNMQVASTDLYQEMIDMLNDLIDILDGKDVEWEDDDDDEDDEEGDGDGDGEDDGEGGDGSGDEGEGGDGDGDGGDGGDGEKPWYEELHDILDEQMGEHASATFRDEELDHATILAALELEFYLEEDRNLSEPELTSDWKDTLFLLLDDLLDVLDDYVELDPEP